MMQEGVGGEKSEKGREGGGREGNIMIRRW
jgi:hypothetical protein